ncbi:hypothetical protein [Nocardioides sp. AE5]|uniref:hypothetical protein n=1 Tax=Nocardioides sp. AE5 TaxID=2962573 RepID=UPI002881E066|nr:hypothetical protein [Nocardioides sp. AE5]MDT0203255.1 hypothetical protein [Nocardioides sp. AE5]
MEQHAIVFISLGVGGPLFAALIVGVILYAGKARPRPDLGVRPAPADHHALASATPPGGRWNMQLLSSSLFGKLGGTLGSTNGEVEIANGHLGFFPRGSSQPAWSYPCHQLAVRPQTAFNAAGLLLWTPHGQIRCNVSREHINIFSRNTIKTLREPRYFREFAEVLWANGAQRR